MIYGGRDGAWGLFPPDFFARPKSSDKQIRVQDLCAQCQHFTAHCGSERGSAYTVSTPRITSMLGVWKARWNTQKGHESGRQR